MDLAWRIVTCAMLLGATGPGSLAAGEGVLPAASPRWSDDPEAGGVREGLQAAPLPPIRAAPQPTTFGPPLAPAAADIRPKNRAPAADSAMTLAELEAIALANNPTLIQANARIEAARAKCLQAGLYPNPSIIYRGEEIGAEGRAGQQGVFVGQEIVTAGKLGLGRAVVAQEVQQAEHARQAQWGRVLNDLRVSWHDVLVAQRTVELNRQLVRIGREGLKAAEQLLAGKEIGRGDVLQFRIEADKARIQLHQAQNRHLGAWRRLAAVLGVAEMGPTRLAGELGGALRELTWEESLERLLAESPELARARSGVQRARCVVARECAQRVPNLELETGVQYQHSADETVVGVQLGLPLPIFNRNQGNILKAQAELIAAENEVRRLELALQDRLAAAFERYDNARYRAAKYTSDLLPNAKASLELVRIALEYEEFDYLTLLNAQRTYTQVSLAYLESLRELRAGSVLIEGLLLTGGLRGNDD